MSNDRYERIRAALAMGPTPGPWGAKELPRDMQRDGYRFSISRGGLGWWIAKVTHEANGGSGAANAALIAACDPDTIRELLAERDQLAAALEAAREDAERYRCLSAMATQQADYLGPIFRIDVRRSEPHLFNFDAAVDAAIDQALGKVGQEVSDG